MKYMHRMKIICFLSLRPWGRGTHARLTLGTHLTEAVCAWRPQVWRDKAEDAGREINKGLTGGQLRAPGQQCSSGRPSATLVPPKDKMKSFHGKQGTAALMLSARTYAACTDATLHMHTTSTRQKQTGEHHRKAKASVHPTC